jgi:DNA-binding NarL/FixJ family response regulator
MNRGCSQKVISVMVVDDHAIFREALSLSLSQYSNLTVPLQAASGEEALELLAVEHPDVVLMDISLPGMNGLETIRRALEIRSMPIVAISMYERGAYEPASKSAGASAYVCKSAPLAELVSTIEQVVTRETTGGE